MASRVQSGRSPSATPGLRALAWFSVSSEPAIPVGGSGVSSGTRLPSNAQNGHIPGGAWGVAGLPAGWSGVVMCGDLHLFSWTGQLSLEIPIPSWNMALATPLRQEGTILEKDMREKLKGLTFQD